MCSPGGRHLPGSAQLRARGPRPCKKKDVPTNQTIVSIAPNQNDFLGHNWCLNLGDWGQSHRYTKRPKTLQKSWRNTRRCWFPMGAIQSRSQSSYSKKKQSNKCNRSTGKGNQKAKRKVNSATVVAVFTFSHVVHRVLFFSTCFCFLGGYNEYCRVVKVLTSAEMVPE